MVKDEELERIRLKKLDEMRKYSGLHDMPDFLQAQKEEDRPIKVTDSTLMEIVQKYALVVIDCWAPWCAPCHIIAPIIEELARDYAGKVTFGKLNVDENRKVSMQYQIMGIPTLLVFKGGELVDRIVGVIPRQMLEPKITRYLQSSTKPNLSA